MSTKKTAPRALLLMRCQQLPVCLRLPVSQGAALACVWCLRREGMDELIKVINWAMHACTGAFPSAMFLCACGVCREGEGMDELIKVINWAMQEARAVEAAKLRGPERRGSGGGDNAGKRLKAPQWQL